MFGKKFSTTAKCTLLLALVLVLILAGGVTVYAHFATTGHQVAWRPDVGGSSTSASWGSSVTCAPLRQPLASWGS
jgi:hypothetical protein